MKMFHRVGLCKQQDDRIRSNGNDSELRFQIAAVPIVRTNPKTQRLVKMVGWLSNVESTGKSTSTEPGLNTSAASEHPKVSSHETCT